MATLKQKPTSKGITNSFVIGGITWEELKRRKALLTKNHPATYSLAVEECAQHWNSTPGIATNFKRNPQTKQIESVDTVYNSWDEWAYEDQVSAVLDVAEGMIGKWW
jgi:hypothetical protein